MEEIVDNIDSKLEEDIKNKKHRWYLPLLIMLVVSIIMNLLAFSKKFCDVYTDNIYPLINNSLGYITSFTPFAIAEVLMYIGILAILAFIVILILLIFLRKKPKYKRFSIIYSRVIAYAIVVMIFLYTFTWTVPVRCSVLVSNPDAKDAYTLDEIREVRRFLVYRLNACAEEVERDANGKIVYGDVGKGVEDGLKAISDRYPRLKGHYTSFKMAGFSNFLSWMGIGGFTYPFTMEVTGNRYVDKFYYPSLYAHEMAHHKGYYKESEANYLAFLGGICSPNIAVQYSNLYSAYVDIDNEYADRIFENVDPNDINEEAKAIEEYFSEPFPSDRVIKDVTDASDEADAYYEDNVNEGLEDAFSGISGSVADKGWEIQDDILQEYNYDGYILMILQLFDGILY